MNREVSKYFSGFFGAMAFGHVVYAVVTARGMIDAPVFLGRRWGVGYMWTEAVAYSAISLVLGYIGWAPRSERPGRNPSTSATGERADYPVQAGVPSQPGAG